MKVVESAITFVQSALSGRIAAALLAASGAVIATATTANAQIFDRFYDSTTGSQERGSSIEQTTDRGYIEFGTRAIAAGQTVYYLIKTDQNGAVQWAKSYGHAAGGANNFVGSCVRQTRDGGYVLCGTTTNYGTRQIQVIKTDAAGNIMWQTAYAGAAESDPLRGPVIREVSGTQGGYIIAANAGVVGQTQSGVLIRIASGGNLIWENQYQDTRFGPTGSTVFRDVRQDADRSFVVVGSTWRTALPATREALVIKTLPDNPGPASVRVWGPPTDFVEGESMEITTGGGYAFSGHRGTSSSTVLFKTTPALLPIFHRQFNGLDTAYSLRENAWYNLGLTGISTFAGFDAATLLRTDLNGLFQNCYQHPWNALGNKDAAQGVPTMDGGWALGGWTQFGPNPANFSITKTDFFGVSCEPFQFGPPQPGWQPQSQPIQVIPVVFEGVVATQLVAMPDQPRSDYTCLIPSCATPPSGMTFWAQFDNPNPFINSLGTTGPGVPNGGPIPTAGYVNQSFCFNTGAITYIDYPNSWALNFGVGDFTIDAWVRRGAVQNDGVKVIVDHRRQVTPTDLRGYSFFTFNGQLSIQLATGGFFNYVSPTVVPNDNQWHHVAATVRRSGTPPVITFYLNGNPTSTLPINAMHAGQHLNNSAALRIGARLAAGGVAGTMFSNCIDEVELFRRALTTAEVRSIYDARQVGKCREHCTVPTVTFCPADTSLTVTAYICNYSSAFHIYNYTVQGLPVGPGSNIAGPNFVPTSYAPVGIPPGTCAPVTFTMPRPLGLVPGTTARYQMCVTSNSGQSFCCIGQIVGPNPCIIFPAGGGTASPVRMGVVTPLRVEMTNENDTAWSAQLRIRVIGPDMEPDTNTIGLNGLPPGEPIIRGVAIPPHSNSFFDVFADLAPAYGDMPAGDGAQPFYSIILEADLDGDGEWEPLTGRLLQIVNDPPCAADLNLDGEVTSQDFFEFIAAFFSGDLLADINLDGEVTSQDFFNYLTAFFNGCN